MSQRNRPSKQRRRERPSRQSHHVCAGSNSRSNGGESPVIHVTDHAVVRYQERIKGVDTDGIRREIAESLDSPLAKKAIAFGNGSVCKIKAGKAVYCVRGNTVITCMER